jgi:two-component system sensor histidine kinase/response regulator
MEQNQGTAVTHSDVMIVDDNPSNLKLLEELLLQQGYGVRSFPLGRLALAAALLDPPGLILLDINMPEMNGYDVCRLFKNQPALADIPVIFLSALRELQDKVKAFGAGGVDYISKPFQIDEVRARVETHVKLHRLQQMLKAQNEHLEELVAVRTRELSDANRRLTILDRSKSEFLQLISHEFRTPLNGLLGVGELILDSMPPTQDNIELQDLFASSRHRILAILDDALLLTQIDVRMEQFSPRAVSLPMAVDQAVRETLEFAASRRVTIVSQPGVSDLVLGHEKLLIRALHQLLEVAVKFCDPGAVVRVSAEKLRISIDSHGKVLPAPAIERFFDLFSIGEASTSAGDLGLAPAVAYRILALFGSTLSVENRTASPGIRVTICLKRADSASITEGRG